MLASMCVVFSPSRMYIPNFYCCCLDNYLIRVLNFLILFFIDVELIYHVLVSGVQQSDSVIHIYIYNIHI